MGTSDDNGKAPRNTKSWKTEAQKLEGLLVQACGELTHQRFEDGPDEKRPAPDIRNVADVAGWWENHQDATATRTAELKAAGLAKLSDAERRALGVDRLA